jgi:hypothetical protein
VRWVALFLLFLNGLVLGVQWVEDQRDSSRLAIFSRSDGAPGLMLLSESVVGDQGEGSGINSDSESFRYCLLLGPLDQALGARALIDLLAGMDVKSSLYTNSVQLAPEYWVYLKPFAAKDLAIKHLKELQVDGIDSYLINQGELRNGISLGFFRNIDTATLLQVQRRKQGHDAQIKEVPRARTEYWVLLTETVTPAIRSAVEAVKKEIGGKLQARDILCEGVAS